MAPTTPQFASEIVAGIIGFVSAVALLFIAQLLRKQGKIIVNVGSSSLTAYNPDGMGGEQNTTSFKDAHRIECLFGVDFFNSSDEPRSLRAILLMVSSRKLKRQIPLIIYVPKLFSSTPATYAALAPSELHILNIPSKETLHLNIRGYIEKQNLEILTGKVDFFFMGKHPNGKVFRKKLVTQEF